MMLAAWEMVMSLFGMAGLLMLQIYHALPYLAILLVLLPHPMRETSHRSAFAPDAKIVEKLLDLALRMDRFRLSMKKQKTKEKPT
jgi:hypothetical protein